MAFKLWPGVRPPRAAIVAGAALAALAILTLLSSGWAASDEKAFLEFTRVLMYLGVFALVAMAVRARHAAAVSDGLALGIVGVVALALASRFWWGDIGPGAPPEFFPVQTRLHYPVNYWNGLAILAGMALPLLLRAAVAQRPAILRAVALAPVPAIAATIYLTSSRGGAAVAVAGVLVFCALTSRRTSALVAAGIAAAVAVGAVEVLLARDDLVNGPLSAPAVAGQGHSAALWIALLGAAGGALYWAWCRFADWDVRLPRAARAACVVGLAVVAVAGVAAFDPAGKFEDFKRPPGDTTYTEGDFTRSHLLSSASTGRWQLWAAARDQWETRPAFGRGAGSYQSWWTEHADFPLFVRDAHSLWLEMLGELGVAGFLLIVLVFGTGFAAALSRLRAAGPARPLVAALAAVLAAFAVGAAIDWMWELTIVALVAVVALGMLAGVATLAAGRRGAVPPGRGARSRRAAPARAAHGGCRRRGGGDHVRDGADARAGAPGAQPGRGAARRRRGGDRLRRGRPLVAAVGRVALRTAGAGRGAGRPAARRKPAHRGRARARQQRLEHLAGGGAHPDQGWFHTCRAPQPEARAGSEPEVSRCSRLCVASRRRRVTEHSP